MKDNIIGRGVVETISQKSLEEKLRSGKNLRVKFGVDPSRPDIHLGHAVALWQLKQFQDAGHTVIFLMGDYTALVGDPSGKNKTRPVLTPEEIKANAQTYLDQVSIILDTEKIEIRHNSEWFKKMDFADLIQLGANFSVANIIERDDFNKRLKSGSEIAMHELFYPMMQAYDSVMLKADIELGGTDQRFNLLAGRELQKKMRQEPQELIMTELLVGLDGKEKMSKSLGNYVGISEAPAEQFGKLMSINDEMIVKYFKLCTQVSDKDIAEFEESMKHGANPRDIKAKLACEIVGLYHGKEEAGKAQESFDAQFRDNQIPADIEEVELAGNFDPALLIINLGAASSNSEARRLVEQGALKIDGARIEDIKAPIGIASGMIIQVGKRRWWRVK